MVARRRHVSHGTRRGSGSGFTLAAAVLGFFMITLDAVVVSVALPSIRAGLGGGITGLQWVVDGYTLMFAALLLPAGSASDGFGARRAFGAGLTVAVFGALVARPATFVHGVHLSPLIAAAVALAAAASRLLRPGYHAIQEKGHVDGRRERTVWCPADVR
jgi:MFS transporter, DHA2 family, methylenomycin A resistance protein